MKERLLMLVFVVVLGSVLTGALIAVNYYTAPMIEKNEEITIKSSVLQALGIGFAAEDLEHTFAENVQEQLTDGRTFYISSAQDIAFVYGGSGLWGPIQGVIAIRPDLKTLMGVTITRQEETPGLGSRISKEDYLNRFVGMTFVPQIMIVQPGRSVRDNEIDAITGATLTSNAFIAILNHQLDEHVSILKGGRE